METLVEHPIDGWFDRLQPQQPVAGVESYKQADRSTHQTGA
ncbi:hypothetical protein FOZG_18476 [Fusarium oxysporum Fo47]|uniref:Uncharacterized protein n=1 Tax=Fusarium oxysporum Fo47 TaxID=660027 RepID=W9JDS1_FUSOX|nr:hypothetical protein FOZG_18476 [Fusarium oxysporum Fo47]